MLMAEFLMGSLALDVWYKQINAFWCAELWHSYIPDNLFRFLFHVRVQEHHHSFFTPISSSTPCLVSSTYFHTVTVSQSLPAIMYLCHNVTISLSQCLPTKMSLCHNVTISLSQCLPSIISLCYMSLSFCHNVSSQINLGSKYLTAAMPLCHSESCSTSILLLVFIEAKHDSQLAELAFAGAGGYGKGSRCLSKGEKQSTLAAIDVICWNFLMKSCGCINMEECCTLTSLSVDLFIFC